MALRTLTIHTKDVVGSPLAEKEVEINLIGRTTNKLILSPRTDDQTTVVSTKLKLTTDSNGVTRADLTPTADIRQPSRYQITIGGISAIFTMPDENKTLYEVLLANIPETPDTPNLGADRRYLGVFTADPTVRPVSGDPLQANDFYFNSSLTGRSVRFYNGSSWISIMGGDVTIQGDTIVAGAGVVVVPNSNSQKVVSLADRGVTISKMDIGGSPADGNAIIYDGATSSMRWGSVATEGATEGEIYRLAKDIFVAGSNITLDEDDDKNRITVSSAGTGGGVTPADNSVGTLQLKDESVTPIKLDAATTSKKAAFRTRIGAGTSSFSGAYADLTGKPTIPSIAGLATTTLNNLSGSLTNQQKAAIRTKLGAGTSSVDGLEGVATGPEMSGDGTSGSPIVIVSVAASKVSGKLTLANLPSLSASEITSGTFDSNRIKDGAVTDAKIASVAGSKVSGKLDVANIPNLPGTIITSGQIPLARLGTGGATASKVLYGDGTWKVPPSGSGGGISAVTTTPEFGGDGTSDDPLSINAIDAAKISTGVFTAARIPALSANKITTGTFPSERIASNAIVSAKIRALAVTDAKIAAVSASKVTGVLGAGNIPNLAASKINSGTFVDARIPNLAAGKVTSGTFDAARIPSLAASKINSGTFVVARIPDLSADKITSGRLDTARLGTGTADATTILYGDGRWKAAPSGGTGTAGGPAQYARYSITDGIRLLRTNTAGIGLTFDNIDQQYNASAWVIGDSDTTITLDPGYYRVEADMNLSPSATGGNGRYHVRLTLQNNDDDAVVADIPMFGYGRGFGGFDTAFIDQMDGSTVFYLAEETKVKALFRFANIQASNQLTHIDTTTSTLSFLKLQQGQKGEDGGVGPGIFASYSVDGSTAWHETYTTADKYIRLFSGAERPAENSNTWGVATKFIGDDGAAGGGGVSQSTFDDEVSKRESGDELQSIQVNTSGGLTTALNSQATADTQLEIIFTADVTDGGTTYKTGDVVFVPPRSRAIEGRFNVASNAQLSAERLLRQAGDEINEIPVSSAGVLATALTGHDNGNNSSLIRITADFTSGGSTYKSGERYYLAPHHNLASEMVLLSEASTGVGGTDQTARDAAEANKARLDNIPVYAAILTVNPPNVQEHSNLQRKFQSTLSTLDPTLATNAGSTGTRFTNTFRIFTRDADGDVVQLHTQGWSFTSDDRQSIAWEVSAVEFNSVGTSSTTTGIEVWGEFRAVYSGGVNEFRGRTNSVFIDFGEEDEWPATRGDLPAVATTTQAGIVEKSTAAENAAGTATDKYPDVAGVKSMIDSATSGGGGDGDERFDRVPVPPGQNSYMAFRTPDQFGLPPESSFPRNVAGGGWEYSYYAAAGKLFVINPSGGTGNFTVRLLDLGGIRGAGRGDEIAGTTFFLLNRSTTRTIDFQGSGLATIVPSSAEIPPQSGGIVMLNPIGTGSTQTYEMLVAPLGGAGGLSQAQVDARARVRFTDAEKAKLAAQPDQLPPFADVEIFPGGLAGEDIPESVEHFSIIFDERWTRKTISGATLVVAGVTLPLATETPISNIASGTRGVLRFTLSDANRGLINDNTTTTSTDITAELTITYSDSTTYAYSVVFPVNDPSVMPAIPPMVQTLTSAAAVTFNVDDGDIATLTAAHNFTLTLSGGSNGSFALLRVLQDSTGSRTMTFGSGIVLDGRTAPTLSTAAGAHDNILFMRRGTSWVFMGAILNG